MPPNDNDPPARGPAGRNELTPRLKLLVAYLRQVLAEEGISFERGDPFDLTRFDFLVQGDIATLMLDPRWAKGQALGPN